MKFRSRAVLIALALTLDWVGPSPAVAATPPNVIIVMADDLGFSDLGCYGGEIRTPHLDSLAQGGLRLTQFYNSARCCPTRAAMLTGQYPHKVGLARNGRSLTRNGATIAELLKTAGYQTGMSGKWHLSFTPQLPDKDEHQRWIDHRFDPGQPFAPLDTYPVSRGFDRHFGIVWGVVDFFDPFSLVEGLQPVKQVPEHFYLTDAITDHAVGCVKDFAATGKPFFLYVAYTAPHWPLHARAEDIAKYRETYRDGWHALRAARWKRLLALGLFDAKTTTLPELRGIGPDWDELTPAAKELQAAKMAVHAAMVDRLDQGVGQLITALKAAKQFENTVIFFLSDNGASPEIPGAPGYDRSSTTRDGRKLRYDRDGFSPAEIGSQTTYTGIGSWWANAANTPFRLWKKESYEGGAHTPFIAHWPAGLKAKRGASDAAVSHVIDLVPTVLELAGVKYPAELGGNALTPLDGRSFAPLLEDRNLPERGPLYFEHENGRAIRVGDWKLVAESKPGSAWELFNLATDRTETRNLAVSEPAKVAELQRQWETWAKQVGVPEVGAGPTPKAGGKKKQK